MTATSNLSHRTEKFLVTGTAGFIGFHVARRLLDAGLSVIGVDGMTPYYDVELKRRRHAILSESPLFTPHEFMLEENDRLAPLVATEQPEIVIHLAAQAGVRYSTENPRAYIDSNVVGTFNLLEACRAHMPRHLLIASTSSVYGDSNDVPYREDSDTSHPVSLYAATKKAVEVMAYSYASLYRIPTTAFRFFTVYGPWGRPDMALFKFTSAILEDREIEVYGQGQMSRDFTYIDDLVNGIVGLVDVPPVGEGAPFREVNIGASQPVELEAFIAIVERELNRKAKRKYLPMQLGDVRRTHADVARLRSLIDYPTPTTLDVGVRAFVEWYMREYASQPAKVA